MDYPSAGREFAGRREVQTLLLETDESDSYLFQKIISEMHICWLLVALIVSGEFCQIGSFKGGKAIESFDVKQDC